MRSTGVLYFFVSFSLYLDPTQHNNEDLDIKIKEIQQCLQESVDNSLSSKGFKSTFNLRYGSFRALRNAASISQSESRDK